jgi:hypothetical protein
MDLYCQDFFKKNTTRRVEIVFEKPAGLGLDRINSVGLILHNEK